MNLSLLDANRGTPLWTALVLFAMASQSCGDCRAQSPNSDTAVKIDPAPPQNPWSPLEDMQSPLGRFVLASDQQRIYQLGGISFNIRRGQRYGHHFAAYDPNEQKWKDLPNTPLGTGGAQLAYWPAKQCLVMIGGIKKLGDRFSSDAIKIGIYAIASERWTSKVIRCKGLGRVAGMIHLDEDRFLLVAGGDDLNAERTAVLEIKAGRNSDDHKPMANIVGTFPKRGRILGLARTGDVVDVLQSDSRDGTRLQRFSASSGEHLDSVELSTQCSWTDKLLAWKGNLLIWKNEDASRPDSYTHTSQLLLVDPGSGQCQTLHPEHPGPIARRSSEGIVVGDGFYVFGGQGDDKAWLRDAHRYQFSSGS